MAKAGDIVRFLNAVGGGTISKIVGNMAYVIDEDGFETPVLIKECVVIETQKKVPSVFDTPAKPQQLSKYVAPVEEPVKELPVIETPEGELMNVLLAYEANSLKTLSSTGFETYLVNDSNYYLDFIYLSEDEAGWKVRYQGTVEPNIQVHLESIGHESLPELSRIAVQFVSYKKGKAFKLRTPVSVEHKVDTTKFYKLHCFQENEYFDEKVMAYPIVTNDMPVKQILINPRELEDSIKEKARIDINPRRPVTKHEKAKSNIIECDLHIQELLDNTAGLSNSDIIEVQLKEFNRVMKEHIRFKGTKIVFIHGKGEGVLRKAVLDELKKYYKNCDVQDASFREYGFGATLVTIR